MSKKHNKSDLTVRTGSDLSDGTVLLLNEVETLIEEFRLRAFHQVNTELVLLYWRIGSQIRQGILKEDRAEYGKQVLESLGHQLTIALKPGQSVTVGDVVTLTVRDPSLSGGLQNVSYTVVSGNDLAAIATGLKNAVNANSALSTLGVTATSASATVTIKSTSANPTVYRDATAATAKEYIDLNVCPNRIETIGVTGTKTTSDVLTVVFIDSGLSGGTRTINYSVQAGDNLTSFATGISNAINADTGLQGIGVSSTSSGQIVSISSNSPNRTTIRTSTNANATEVLKQGLPPNGTQTAIIGGTKTTGNVLTITVYDAGLAGGSKAINYTVQGGDTLATMTSGLAAAITADTSLAAIGVSATAVSTVVNIKSNSQNATTYTSSLSGGATATIALARTIGAQLSAYNNVNELTSIAAGGPVRFQASTNKALKSASVNSNPATLTTTKNFVRDEALSSGVSAASVAATDGANNTKTNTYQVNVNPVPTQNLTYDANGNMTSDGTNTYKWDAENRLIEIDYPGSGNKSEFVYDGRGAGTKIVETVAGTVTETRQIVRFNSQIFEERDAAGNTTKQFSACGQTLINGAAPSNYFYSKDHLGSTRELVSATSLASSYTFGPYGTVLKNSELVIADFQYAGYFVHSRSNLILTSFRAYKPFNGRWLNRDPAGELAFLNLFAYVSGNPISMIDPLGLDVGYSGGAFQQLTGIEPAFWQAPNGMGCRSVVNSYLGLGQGDVPELHADKCWFGSMAANQKDIDAFKCDCAKVVWTKIGPLPPNQTNMPSSGPVNGNPNGMLGSTDYNYAAFDESKNAWVGAYNRDFGHIYTACPRPAPSFGQITCVTCRKGPRTGMSN
ncbi:MAG: hypothetical protein K2Y39_18005 [Candidatus Obscuribacterales bacterium]|nr:hypothetical protein [Candidatus Obscuribacterales bacterium]